MYKGRKIAVVMPAHNEERLVRSALESVPDFVDRIFLVNDGSDDRTAQEAVSVRDTRIVLIEHGTNMGVGAAIATGYKAALEMGFDVTCVMAGDGQMDPRDLPGLVEAVIRGAGYAKGNRFSWGGPERQPLPRYIGGMVLSYVTRAVVGCRHVFDSQCGYTAISRAALSMLDLDDIWPRFGYPNDLLSKLHNAGVRIVDVPVRPVYKEENSHLTPLRALRDIPPALVRCGLHKRRDGRSRVRCGYSS